MTGATGKVGYATVQGLQNILDGDQCMTVFKAVKQEADAAADLAITLAKGQKKLVLNLGDVNYIDSSGIGELVSAYTTVKNQGGELKLLNLTKKVHDLLQITKLYTVFDVKEDEAAAVKAFR